ncbi:glycosyltransferase family 25 protein [Mesorhizobium xinjiangense]|uniref:glycosyltransferase family 25 protein n=1 Tax=Mesorhizobium xinjiangense TaxID=2678685 RepID=UPI0012ED8551|nr:glycosyltransferase family 25 protein [Mesorhizobium xinjiangense]
MKIFLINLDRAPERLERMTCVLDELDLAFTRIAATDGRTLSTTELDHWVDRNADRRLAPGEVACFLSHRRCWQRIVDEGLPYAVVLEDDLHFGLDAELVLGDASWIPPGTDVVKIETKLDPTQIDKAVTAAVGERTLHKLRDKHVGGGAYIVSSEGAQRLLQMSQSLSNPVDHFIFNPELASAASLQTFQLVPAVCIQDFVVKDRKGELGLGSDLHEERAQRKPRGLAKLWREIKRPFFKFVRFVRTIAVTRLTDKRWAKVPFE